MRSLAALLLAGGAIVASAPASAQSVDIAAVQRQIADMQAEIARLSAQVAELRAREEDRATEPAPAPLPTPAPSTQVAWKGAPEISGDGGWSFKPRGRLQLDSAVVDAPSGIAGNGLGAGSELRRAFLGVEGTLPGGFGYRVEADFANSDVDLTDVYLTYKASKELTFTLGQHKPFWGLEEMTSDLFTSMMERAAFNSAFGFERRVGASGTYTGKSLIVQLGMFADNAADLNADRNNSFSLDGRVVISPKVGGATLHLGASAHIRDFNDATDVARYRARPFVHTTDVRLVDTGLFSATSERSFGAELAVISGPFHATAEGHRLTSLRPGLPDPSFWGGYVEVGLLVTPGDKAAYRNGAYDRIRPVNPLSAGGIGAIQVNARYDRIDLNDGVIVGGTQQAAGLSAIWIPTEFVRFLINYGHLWIEDPAAPAWTDPSVQVDTLGVRAQVDF